MGMAAALPGGEPAVRLEPDALGVDVAERLLDSVGDRGRRVDPLTAAIHAAEADEPIAGQLSERRGHRDPSRAGSASVGSARAAALSPSMLSMVTEGGGVTRQL